MERHSILKKESDSGSADEDDEGNLNVYAEQYHTSEFAERLKVAFLEQRTSFAIPARSSFSEMLNATRSQFSRIGIFENPFEHETRIASTLLATKEIRPIRTFDPITSRPMLHSGSTGFPHQRSIPKLRLREFDGDPSDWPEWSGIFLATIDSSSLTKDEKMGHLKTLLSGKPKRAVSGMGYTGAMYDQACSTLTSKFGQPHHIVSKQLSKIQNFPQVKYNDMSSLVEFADAVLCQYPLTIWVFK